MLIDCDTCRAPTGACGDCVMTILLDQLPAPVELDPTEQAAISCLAGAGLVPPLRLVAGVTAGLERGDGHPQRARPVPVRRGIA